MFTARQLPIIMGLSSAALMLIVTVSISTPFATLCIYSSRYSLAAIKSMCVEYVHSMWSLLSRPVYDSKEPIIITPRNIFLLVNLIILFLFVSMHVQQHASAVEKRSSRKKRQQHREKLIMDNKQATPLQPLEGSSLAGSTAAAAMVSEALSISSECAAELSPLQASMESSENQSAAVAGSLEETLTVDSDRINGPDVEQIVLEEDGRLRLIEGPISPKGSDAEKLEDERLRLIESTNSSDEEKIVLEKDGRLRLMDTPLPSYSKPEKSLSYPSDSNHNANYDTHSLNDVNYDIPISLNTNHNLTHDTFTNKSSSLKRTSSKPMRVKKSDSLDATWKAMNHNKGSAAVNVNDRDHKPLIRQSSRTDFKPSRGGRGGVIKATASSRVRREPSISQEELNAKVESFIAKFNEQIRIERQQSILSYMQMVDRGA